MDLTKAILLGAIQGITEFLPISSSGHLAIFQNILRFNKPLIFFDVMLHFGSLVAIIIFFKDRIFQITEGLIKKDKKIINYVGLLIIATIPAMIVGLFFDEQIETTFISLKIVGIFFLLTSILLISTKLVNKQNMQFNYLNWKNAIFVGIIQAIAIFPGVSRSGSTITSALWRGFSKQDAFEFSFFLAIPAILGALVFKIKNAMIYENQDFLFGIIGMIISAITSFWSLLILQKILKSANFFWFGVYCGALGIILLIFFS